MLTCPKCGYDNELGRIFCHSCGAKLDLSEMKSPSQGGAKLKKKGSGGAGRLVGRTIGVVILVALVAVIYLAAQVPDVHRISTTSQDQRSAQQKRFDLDQITSSRQPQVITVTEAEINAFIDQGFKTGDGKGLAVTPSNLQLELGDGVVKAVFLGKLSVGTFFSKGIYLSLTGAPMIDGGRFEFMPVSGAIGALPVHPWLIEHTGLLKHYFEKLFASQGQEKQTLDSLKSITVTPQEIVLLYEPPAATQ
jgi:hypothetical protein